LLDEKMGMSKECFTLEKYVVVTTLRDGNLSDLKVPGLTSEL
jgi:hypothetical protein